MEKTLALGLPHIFALKVLALLRTLALSEYLLPRKYKAHLKLDLVAFGNKINMQKYLYTILSCKRRDKYSTSVTIGSLSNCNQF
jgi:hypothetical protein